MESKSISASDTSVSLELILRFVPNTFSQSCLLESYFQFRLASQDYIDCYRNRVEVKQRKASEELKVVPLPEVKSSIDFAISISSKMIEETKERNYGAKISKRYRRENERVIKQSKRFYMRDEY